MMTQLTPDLLRSKHRPLAQMTYDVTPVRRGYANHTLHVDLSANTITGYPVTQQMKDLFTGGKGFGLWLLWNSVTAETTWDSPENAL